MKMKINKQHQKKKGQRDLNTIEDDLSAKFALRKKQGKKKKEKKQQMQQKLQ